MSTPHARREDNTPPIQYADCEEIAKALEELLAQLPVEQRNAMPGVTFGAPPERPIIDSPTAALEQEIRQLQQALEEAGCRHDHHRR
jgi:hypothetical protein